MNSKFYIVCSADYQRYYDIYGGSIDLYNFLETAEPMTGASCFVRQFYPTANGTIPVEAVLAAREMSNSYKKSHFRVVEWTEAMAAAIWNAAIALDVITKEFDRVKKPKAHRQSLYRAGKLLTAMTTSEVLGVPAIELFERYSVYNPCLGKYLCNDGTWATAEELLDSTDRVLGRFGRGDPAPKCGLRWVLWEALWRIQRDVVQDILPPYQYNQNLPHNTYFVADGELEYVMTHAGLQSVESLIEEPHAIELFCGDRYTNIPYAAHDAMMSCRGAAPLREWYILSWDDAAAAAITDKLVKTNKLPEYAREAYREFRQHTPIERLDAIYDRLQICAYLRGLEVDPMEAAELFLDRKPDNYFKTVDGKFADIGSVSRKETPISVLKLYTREQAEVEVQHPMSLRHALLLELYKSGEMTSAAYSADTLI